MRFAGLVLVLTVMLGLMPVTLFGQSPVRTAPQPTWTVGDTWTYMGANGSQYSYTITGVAPDHYLLEYKEGSSDSAVQVGFDFSPGWFARFQWPLLLKKQWSFNTEGPAENGKSGVNKFTTSMTVEAYESVTVPAGTFDTFRVKGIQCNQTQPGCGDFLVWYAPRAKNYVKVSWITPGHWIVSGKSTELLSYEIH